MADKKISQLTAATLPLAGTELLPIVQSGTTDNITVNNLAAGNLKSNATTGVLQVTGPAAASTRVMTTPNANFTVARTDADQTFSGTQTFTGINATSFSKVTAESAAIGSIGLSLQVTRTTNDSTLYSGYRTTPDAWVIGASYASTGAYKPIILATSDLASLQVETNGDVTAKRGNLVIGTSGKGIDFSATANGSGTMTSELLADYEEGTWTPVIGGAGGTSGQAYSRQLGWYTKVGNMVYCSFSVILSTKGTITSTAQIQGLPYTSSSATNYWSGGSVVYWANLAASATVNLTLAVGSNTTGATIEYVATAASGNSDAGTALFSDTSRLDGFFSYRV